MKLFCKECSVALTRELAPLREPGLLNNQPGHDYVPPGFYVILGAPGTQSPSTAREPEVARRDITINLKDLVNTQRHHDAERLQGCCGPDGDQGNNVLCSQGHEVGVERSDCWMAHEFTFDPDRVKGRTPKTYACSGYRLDLGVPFIEFVGGLGLCRNEVLGAAIQAGEVELNGQPWTDPNRLIHRRDIEPDGVLTYRDQELRLMIWVDDSLL